MIENLIILARRFFKHEPRLARGAEYQKILMVDPQLPPVGQVKNDGLPVGPNGFDALNSHARKTLTDVPSVFHSDSQPTSVCQATKSRMAVFGAIAEHT